MRVFTVQIADKVIEITAQFTRIFNICRDFMTNLMPDFRVQCSIEDYDGEAEVYESYYHHTAPSDVYLEECAILRKVSEQFIVYGIFMLHGAAIINNDKTIIFCGDSGIGKTTHILKWMKAYPDTIVINGDKPFISVNGKEGKPIVYSSPWSGKEQMHTNICAPLTSIVFMERSEKNSIERLSFSQAFIPLIQQIYKSKNAEKMTETLKLLKQLDGKVSFYRFYCNNFKDDCLDVAYNALVRDSQ